MPVVIGLSAGLFVVVVILSAYLYGPMVPAKFGLVDDHEILAYFGTKKSVSIFDLPRILATQTEVGRWGSTERFRPLYYVFRVLETAWHGLDSSAWYVTRIAILAVSAGGIGFLAYRAISVHIASRARQLIAFFLAAVAGLLVLTLPAWADIVTRLGPSEIYVALGVVLLSSGILEIWVRHDRHIGWILAAAGFVIIVGSKEDGLLLLPVMALVYIVRFPPARARVSAIIAGAVALAFSVYVAMGFLPAVSKSGSDVYGNGHSIVAFLRDVRGNEYLVVTALALLFTFVADTVLSRGTPNEGNRWNRVLGFLGHRPRAVIAAVCLYIVLAELYFYQSYVSNGTFIFPRYGLLTEFATAIAFAAAAAALVELVLQRRLRVVAIIAMVVLLALPPTIEQVANSFATYRTTETDLTAALKSQYAQIQRGVADIRAHPSTQVVILVQDPGDYELIVGLTSFLRLHDHITGIFLRSSLPDKPVPGEVDLAAQLNGYARHGGWEQNGWRVEPASAYVASERTACFYFRKRPADTSMCSVTYRII